MQSDLPKFLNLINGFKNTSLNPNCETAKIGLARLEKIMKGLDPDVEAEEEYDEEDQTEQVEVNTQSSQYFSTNNIQIE